MRHAKRAWPTSRLWERSGLLPAATLSHVGIYVKNGSFIHSPRPGGVVKVSNLAEPAWSKQFAGARRILP